MQVQLHPALVCPYRTLSHGSAQQITPALKGNVHRGLHQYRIQAGHIADSCRGAGVQRSHVYTYSAPVPS